MLILCLQRLDEQDFGEKKEINKRKKLILEGKVSGLFCIKRRKGGEITEFIRTCIYVTQKNWESLGKNEDTFFTGV